MLTGSAKNSPYVSESPPRNCVTIFILSLSEVLSIQSITSSSSAMTLAITVCICERLSFDLSTVASTPESISVASLRALVRLLMMLLTLESVCDIESLRLISCGSTLLT